MYRCIMAVVIHYVLVFDGKCSKFLYNFVSNLVFLIKVLIAAFSFVYGNPVRIINGYDSFGNTCGSRNKPMGNLELSGKDTTTKPYLLFYDIKELRNSLKICVEECPKRTLIKAEDIYDYYSQEKVHLCKYDFQYSHLRNNSIDKKILSSSFGPCPLLPVYERFVKFYMSSFLFNFKYCSISVLNRCVPKPVKDVAEGVLSNFYGLLNEWDTLEQILGDLYNTWREIIGLTFLALCKIK